MVSVDESWAIFTSSAIRPKDWDTTRVVVMGEGSIVRVVDDSAWHHVVRVPITMVDFLK